MIDKNYGSYMLVCDICGDEAEESFDTFQDAVDGRKESDWKSQKTSKGWEDVCPICQV